VTFRLWAAAARPPHRHHSRPRGGGSPRPTVPGGGDL